MAVVPSLFRPACGTGSDHEGAVVAGAGRGRRGRHDPRRPPRGPLHYDSRAHFTEGRDDLTAAFTSAGLADRLDWGRAELT